MPDMDNPPTPYTFQVHTVYTYLRCMESCLVSRSQQDTRILKPLYKEVGWIGSYD